MTQGLAATTRSVATIEEFSSPSPYVIENGDTVNYTGASGTVTNDLKLSGSASVTLGVADSATTLTWDGNVTAGPALYLTGAGSIDFIGDSVAFGDLSCSSYGSVRIGAPSAVWSSAYCRRGTTTLDGVNATCGNTCVGYEVASAGPTLTLTNKAVLALRSGDDYENAALSGIRVGGSATMYGQVNVEDGARLSHVGMTVKANSEVHVGKGATLAFSRPILGNDYSATEKYGSVTIDGGTLTACDSSQLLVESTRRWAQWFNGMTNLYVGTLGATLVAPSALASLWPRLTAAEGASGASVTKTGTGSLALRATTLPVTVSAGDLRLAVAESNAALQDQFGATAFASGTTATLTGFRGAAKTDLSTAPTVKFHPAGVETIRGQWKANGWATIRPDGYLQMSDSRASWNGKSGVGSVFRKDKVSVNESFNVEFSVVEWNIKGGSWHDQFGGFALVFQNATNGTSAVGTEAESVSLCGYGAALQDNAFALLFYCTGTGTLSTGNGATVTQVGTFAGANATSSATLDKPVRIGFAYDAAAKKATVTWLALAKDTATPQQTWTIDVDLPSAVGADEAYMGFTGACYGGWKNSVFAIGNVARTTSATRPAAAMAGGTLTLAAGATRAFKTFADKAHAGFLMDTLNAGEGAVLDIASLNAADSADSFVGFETYACAGTLVKRGAGRLGLVSEQAKDVALKVEEGGLVVRSATDVPDDPLAWDWAYSDGYQGYEWPMLGEHGGITIGDDVGWKGYCATTRHTFDITGNWRFSLDVYPKGLNSSNDGGTHAVRANRMGYSLGFAFHDDPRGVAYEPTGNNKGAGLLNSLKYGAGMALCPCNSCGENKHFGPLVFGTSADAACTSVSYSKADYELYTENSVTNGSVLHITMEYAAATGVMTYTVRHNDEAGYTRTYTDDLAKRIASGRAHLTLSTANKSGDVALLCEYANMKFERLDPPAAKSETVLASLTTTAASVPLCLANETNAAFRVGAAQLAASGALAVTAPTAAATLELGSLAAADGCPTLELGENVTVAVDAATGVKTLTVNGGTLRLTSATALPETACVVLTNDACLDLDFDGTMAIRRLSRNGTRIRGIVPAGTPGIGGTGRLVVGAGMMMIVR